MHFIFSTLVNSFISVFSPGKTHRIVKSTKMGAGMQAASRHPVDWIHVIYNNYKLIIQ